MSSLYPLRFQPLFRQYIWGGRRLQTSLGKAIGSGDDYAESWELVDHGEDQSRVLAGELAGSSLHELLANFGEQLFGDSYATWNQTERPEALQYRFPLLFKFLDCNRPLSVQVHPNDEQGGTLNPPDLGKTEAWVVLEAEAGSKIYAGLKSGVNREQLADAVASGETESVLHAFEPRVGDCVFIPAGTVHALGAGLVIAEIQQASDTTFRLFDWNRVDSEGNSRPLHIDESLAVTDFDHGPVHAVQATAKTADRELLVECDKFVLQKRRLTQPTRLGEVGEMRFIAVINGSISVDGDPLGSPIERGETVLLPASCGDVVVTPSSSSEILEVTLPA